MDGLDDDLGSLVRAAYESMRHAEQSDGDAWPWYDPLVTKRMDEHNESYSVAETHVVNDFLDAYNWFDQRDELCHGQGVGYRRAVTYYSVCTAAASCFKEQNIDLSVLYG